MHDWIMIKGVNKTVIILGLLLLVGVFLRVFHLSLVPLYGDELTIVLDSKSLLESGRDQTGQFMPVTFSMGAGRPAGYVYGSIPFVALFGANEWGVRGLSILSGMLIIILMYLLGRKLFDRKVGIAAAILYTFSFWDINLSRGGFEAHFALFLALGGIVATLYAKGRRMLLILAGLCFGLSFHTYPTYKLVLPLFLIIFFLYLDKKAILFKTSKTVLISALSIFLFLGVTALLQTFISGSENRFLSINVFSDSQIQTQIAQKIIADRTSSALPPILNTLFFNQLFEELKIIGQNYLHNFSVDFLFLLGDRNPRHNMAAMGYFYFVEIITLALGIIALVIQKKWRLLSFLLGWVVVSPIASAIVSDPHGLRSAFLLPVFILTSAYGLCQLLLYFSNTKQRLVLGVVVMLFISQFAYFGAKLYFLSPQLYARFWAHEGKFASLEALKLRSDNKFVVISDRIDSVEFAYPVYANIPSKEVISQFSKSETLPGGSAGVKKFGNIYIGNVTVEQLRMIPDSIYIGRIDEKEKLGEYYTIQDTAKQDILVVGQVK